MSHVEEDYGVKVSFDNQDFNNNVDSSEKKLNSFENSLTSFADSLKNIRFNGNINLGEILNFASLQTGFYRIRNEIESLANPIESVSHKALQIVSNTMTQAINQIKSGGMQRALNIEAAKFQIEGLKLDVDTFMEAADYAVSGTAYSLDAAAKAASQLGASGVTQLEDLKKALRGVSGVAAMANSDFESIAHIFTTVAGQGKLTSMQLQSLSYRGLNVAAELGKALNKTEAEIRDMVTKGKIDFMTFANAMDDAFGEHAKDANKTFTGALSNIRAALSRLGEAFATPIIQNAVDVFNQVRLSINEFKAALQDNFVFEVFALVVEKIASVTTDMFEEFRYGMQYTPLLEEFSYLLKDIFQIVEQIVTVLFKIPWGEFTQIGNSLEVVVRKVKQIVNAFKEAFDEVFGIRKTLADFSGLSLWVTSLLEAFEEINDLDVKDVFKNWLSTIKEVIITMKDVLGITFDTRKSIKDMFANAVAGAMEFFKSLKLSDDTVDKLKRTFSGVASVFVILKSLATSVFDFVKPVVSTIGKIVGGLGKTLLSVLAKLGDFFTDWAKALENQKFFESFFKTLEKHLGGLLDFFKKIGDAFNETFFSKKKEGQVEDNSFIDKLLEFISKVGEISSAALNNLTFVDIDFEPIKNFIKNIANFGFSESEMDDTAEGIEKSKNFVVRILDFIKDLFSHIFGKDGKDIKESSAAEGTTKGISETIKDVLAWIKDLITTLVQNTDPALLASGVLIGLAVLLDSFAGILDVIFKGISGLLLVILGFVAEKDLKKIADINPTEAIDNLTKAFKGFTDSMPKMLNSIKDMVTEFKPFEGVLFGANRKKSTGEVIADVLKAIMWLILAIAGSLFLIAMIPTADLNKAVGALAIMVTLITGVTVAFAIISKTMSPIGSLIKSPLTAIAASFAIIAFAIIEIALALKLTVEALKGINFWEAVGAIGALAAVLAVIVGIIVGFTILQDKIAVLPSDFLFLAGAFALFGLAITEIATAIGIVAMSIIGLGENGTAKAWAAVAMISTILIVAGAIIGIISAFVKGEAAIGTLAVGAALFLALTGLAAVITALVGALIPLAMMEPEKIEKVGDVLQTLLITLGVIAAVLVVVAEAGGLLGEMGTVGLLALALVMFTFTTNLLALAAPLLAVNGILKSFADVLKTFKEIFEYLKGMDPEDAAKVGENISIVIEKILEGIPKASDAMILSAIQEITKVFPYIKTFAINSILPFLGQIFESLSTPLSEKVLKILERILSTMVDYMPEVLSVLYDLIFGPAQILDAIYLWLNELWNRTTDWIKERIPTWVEDIVDILLILVKAINAAMEGKWEEFDEELSKLWKNTKDLIRDVIKGPETENDIKSLMGSIIQIFADGIKENMYILKDAFVEMAGEAVAGFIDTLTSGMNENGFEWDLSGGLKAIGSTIGNYGSNGLLGTFMPNYSNGQERYDDKVLDALNRLGNKKSPDVNLRVEATSDPYGIVSFTTDYDRQQSWAGHGHK